MEARCSFLFHENKALKLRCASLEAENATLRHQLNEAHASTSSQSNHLGVDQSLLNLSGCITGPTSPSFSPCCRLVMPPLDLNAVLRNHQALQHQLQDQLQLQNASSCDSAASSDYGSGGAVEGLTRPPRPARNGSEAGSVSSAMAGTRPSRFRNPKLRATISSTSATHLGAFAAVSQLPCVTLAALTALSEESGLSLGMGVYERQTIDDPEDPAQYGGFKIGQLVFSNDQLSAMHDQNAEIAKERLDTFMTRNVAFRRGLKGLLRNVLRNDLEPVAVRSLFVHRDRPSVMFIIWLYPCSYQDKARYNELAFLMVSVPQTGFSGLTENLLQDHIALKYAPAMVTTVDYEGQVVAQNSASFGALGFHGRDHRRLEKGQLRVHYLKELFLEEADAYESMVSVTAQGGTFSMTIQLQSPILLSWLGKLECEVWHEIQVSKLSHPVYPDAMFIVSETEVTATIVAQRKVAQLQKMQRELLSEILPPQVADRLLDGNSLTDSNFSAYSGKSDADGNRLVEALALQRGALVTVNSASDAPAMDYFDGDAAIRLSRRDVMALATYHEEVTILFTDIVGFTALSQQLHPAEVLLLLNNLYSIYDGLCDVYDVYKVETIGDSFMVAGGLLVQEINADGETTRKLGGLDPQHASKVLGFARAVVAATAYVRTPLGTPVQVRIGIHTGPCMSGVVGRKMPRFCLFGDTINSASRMESTGKPGRIHVSEATHDLLPNES